MAACVEDEMAACALRASCSMFSLTRLYTDEATCDARAVPACESSLMAKGTAQTPAGLEACAEALPDETCVAFFDGNPVAACVAPMGAELTGAACGASGQCQTTFCDITQYQICGTCQPIPTVGDTCVVAADCGRNMACATQTGAASGTCAAYAGTGTACLTNTQPCEAGLACVGDVVATGVMGTCQPQGTTLGAACDSSRKTAANCSPDAGMVCIPTAAGSGVGTCQMISLVAAGAPCGDIGAAPVTGVADCAGDGTCIKPTATAATGTCMAPAADGAACDNDITIGPGCLAGAKCVVPSGSTGTAGTCTTPAAATCT